MENFERSNLLVCAFDEATASRSKLGLRRLILEQGTILCEANDRLRHVYFPMTCVLSSISILSDGTAVETAVAGREGAFGLLTVLGSGRISARCQVQIAGKAMRMEADQFIALFHRNEAVHRLTVAYIETVMFQNLQSVACRNSHTIEARLCRWLLTMQDRVGGNLLSFTHEFVAPALGANRTTLSLAMAELRRAGLLTYARNDVTILARERLERKSCECYFNVRQRYERLAWPPKHK